MKYKFKSCKYYVKFIFSFLGRESASNILPAVVSTFEYDPSKFLILTLLILSGEFIYFLPYVLSRVFRPTFLDVFQLNNFYGRHQFALFLQGIYCIS